MYRPHPSHRGREAGFRTARVRRELAATSSTPSVSRFPAANHVFLRFLVETCQESLSLRSCLQRRHKAPEMVLCSTPGKQRGQDRER